jgi:hypothetical protein
MVGGVIDAYLALLGALLAGVTVLVIVFVVAMARGPTRGLPLSTVLGASSGVAVTILGLGAIAVASMLLAPVLVIAVATAVLPALGYTAWRLLRRSFPARLR